MGQWYLLSDFVKNLCIKRDFYALNVLYHQLIDKFARVGLLPVCRYNVTIHANNIYVAEISGVECAFRLVDRQGNDMVLSAAQRIPLSDKEKIKERNIYIYSILLSLAVLKVTPEVFSDYSRDNVLLVAKEDFDEWATNDVTKFIANNCLEDKEVRRWFDLLKDIYFGTSVILEERLTGIPENERVAGEEQNRFKRGNKGSDNRKNCADDIHTVEPCINVADCNIELGADGKPLQKIPVFTACEMGFAETLWERITSRGFNIDEKNSRGYTLLHVACNRGYEEIVQMLLKKGANVNMRDGRCSRLKNLFNLRGETPLHRAVVCNNSNVVRMLIEAKANVNVFDYYARTPLHYACIHGNMEIIRYLVENGAWLNVRDDYGNQPALLAVKRGRFEIVKYFVYKGVDIDVANNAGETMLYKAVKEGDCDIVTFLIEHGADVDFRDRNYRNALHLAVENENIELINYFINKGVDSEAKDIKDRSPLNYAEKSLNMALLKTMNLKKNIPE